MKNPFKVTKEFVQTLVGLIDLGLPRGLGYQEPGQMCVQACVKYTMGMRHGDKPSCVDPRVTRVAITLNDMMWSGNEARGKGMRRLAVAQLGSVDVIDREKFSEGWKIINKKLTSVALNRDLAPNDKDHLIAEAAEEVVQLLGKLGSPGYAHLETIDE